jgi:Tfp pilus assembly PilM family ATPase
MILDRGSFSPIGLDVSGRGVAAVQLAGRGQSRRISAFAWLPRTGDAFTPEECTRTRGVLERNGFRGKEIVLAAPDAALRTAPLELPPRSSGAPIDQLARLELARTHKLDQGALEIAVWDMPGAGGAGTSVLAAALPHADADRLLAPFDAAGFDAVAIEPRVCALCRLAARAAEPSAVTGIVEVGEDAAVLAVIHQWCVAYERVMPECGIGPLRKELAHQLQVQPDVVDLLLGGGPASAGMPAEGFALIVALAESLGTEIKTAVEYVGRQRAGGVASDLVLVAGPGASVPGVEPAVAAAFGATVRPLTPTVAFPGASGASSPALATATGLAMHEEGR